MRKLPKSRFSLLDTPELIRLSNGAEIDRIGERCYSIPASNCRIDTAINPQFARVMQPLFAHEVSCPGMQRKPQARNFWTYCTSADWLPKLGGMRRRRVLVLMFVLLTAHIVEIWIFGAVMYGLVQIGGTGWVTGQVTHGFPDYVYFRPWCTPRWGSVISYRSAPCASWWGPRP